MEKYIYISIPKTGTNSIHKLLGHSYFNHITANMIRNKIGKQNYHARLSFCFIRNPVDLVKSWYYYHKYSPNVVRKEVKNYYPDTIEEWVFQMNCKTHWEEPLHKKFNPDWNLSNPLYQTKWIKDKDDNVIVDKVYKFDDINEHVYKMFDRRVNVENKSNKDDYVLQEETENQIRVLFADEIEFYNGLT
jgi:hypothetical protein